MCYNTCCASVGATAHQPGRWRRRRCGGGIVVSWCGMRGIVTLAAALRAAGRNLSVSRPDPAAAFAVVLGTLVIQGLTLRPLIRRCGLTDDDPVAAEVGRPAPRLSRRTR